jgi:GNAT superfamily N-acetyltransferase
VDGHDLGLRLTLEPADTDASRELQRAYFADIASRYLGWDPDVGPSADPSELGPPGGAWVVAYLDGRPVGCGGLKAVDAEMAEIRRVFLDRLARGRGIGRQLLQELEEHARRLGYQRVRLTTGDRQPEALGLFRAAGYVEVADFNGYHFARHWMEKEL